MPLNTSPLYVSAVCAALAALLMSCSCPEPVPAERGAASESTASRETTGFVFEALLVDPDSWKPITRWGFPAERPPPVLQGSALDYTGHVFTRNLLSQDHHLTDLGTWSIGTNREAHKFGLQRLIIALDGRLTDKTVTVQAGGMEKRVCIPEQGGVYFHGFKAEPGLVLIVSRCRACGAQEPQLSEDPRAAPAPCDTRDETGSTRDRPRANDDVLKLLLSKSELVVVAKITEAVGIWTNHIGVWCMSCTVSVEQVLKGRRGDGKAEMRLTAEYYGGMNRAVADKPLALEQGRRCVFFLRRKTPSSHWVTADLYFGVQHANERMIQSLKRLQ